jgi:hypothetical protein
MGYRVKQIGRFERGHVKDLVAYCDTDSRCGTRRAENANRKILQWEICALLVCGNDEAFASHVMRAVEPRHRVSSLNIIYLPGIDPGLFADPSQRFWGSKCFCMCFQQST